MVHQFFTKTLDLFRVCQKQLRTKRHNIHQILNYEKQPLLPQSGHPTIKQEHAKSLWATPFMNRPNSSYTDTEKAKKFGDLSKLDRFMTLITRTCKGLYRARLHDLKKNAHWLSRYGKIRNCGRKEPHH